MEHEKCSHSENGGEYIAEGREFQGRMAGEKADGVKNGTDAHGSDQNRAPGQNRGPADEMNMRQQGFSGPTGHNPGGMPPAPGTECAGRPYNSGFHSNCGAEQMGSGFQKAMQGGYTAHAGMNPGYMNPGYMNQGYVNPGYMNPENMNPGYMDQARMDQFKMDQFKMEQFRIDQARASQEQANYTHMNQARMNQGDMNRGNMNQMYGAGYNQGVQQPHYGNMATGPYGMPYGMDGGYQGGHDGHQCSCGDGGESCMHYGPEQMSGMVGRFMSGNVTAEDMNAVGSFFGIDYRSARFWTGIALGAVGALIISKSFRSE